MKPRLGMHFDYLDEAYNFYNAYGKLAGFSIRKESSNRGKDGEVVWKLFVCSKEGKTDEKHWIGKELVQRCQMETRFDCKAKLQVKLDKSSGYVVSMFVHQHSHALATPSKRFMLRSHREVPESKRQLINIYDAANVQSKQQIQVFASQSGGLDKIGFTDMDARNHRRDEKEKKRGLDEIEREVLWKKDEKHAYCSCKKFEFEGIPCCHVLSILRRGSILILPERYILKRWTKGVTKDVFVDVMESGESEGVNPYLARHSHLSCMFAGLIDIASQSKDGIEFLISGYTELEMKLRQMMLNNRSNSSIDKGKALVDSNVVEYNEPAHVVTKGRAKRLKSLKEKAIK
ncbi:hypothetical protein MRB53_035090 [Persea americana]|uniref:Uncharacterized protein n=1 Tax=Persea americana TaxID=3435 RepID=A0ACC2K495_PERAE|nr:hypothetical protein MRB53_035090 [Persea americana]